jgi:hypothetical protein
MMAIDASSVEGKSKDIAALATNPCVRIFPLGSRHSTACGDRDGFLTGRCLPGVIAGVILLCRIQNHPAADEMKLNSKKIEVLTSCASQPDALGRRSGVVHERSVRVRLSHERLSMGGVFSFHCELTDEICITPCLKGPVREEQGFEAGLSVKAGHAG